MKQIIKLNQVNSNNQYKKNGIFRLYIDGKKKIDIPNFVFRTDPSVHAIGIDFATFFGGSGKEWAAVKDEFTFFKNVRLASYWIESEEF